MRTNLDADQITRTEYQTEFGLMPVQLKTILPQFPTGVLFLREKIDPIQNQKPNELNFCVENQAPSNL